MTAQMQAIPAPQPAASASRAQLVAFALLAGTLIVAVALAARAAVPAGAPALDRAIGVPFPGGVAGPSQLTPDVSVPTTRPPLRITGPLHPPRNTTRGVDPVQEAHRRMV